MNATKNKKQNGRPQKELSPELLKKAYAVYLNTASLRKTQMEINNNGVKISTPTISKLFKANSLFVQQPTINRKHNSKAPFTDESQIPKKTITLDVDNYTKHNLYGKKQRVIRDIDAQLIKIRNLEDNQSLIISAHNIRVKKICDLLMSGFRERGYKIATDKAFSGDIIPHHFKRTHALKENITAPLKEKVYQRAEILKHHTKQKIDEVAYMRIFNDEMMKHNLKNAELRSTTKEILINERGAYF